MRARPSATLRANAVSGDGSVLVGAKSLRMLQNHAFRWSGRGVTTTSLRKIKRGVRSVPLEWPVTYTIYHPYRWHMDGDRMAENVHQLRAKPGDTEKITINLGYVDLGHIDLMVQEGFYSNRTD